VLYNREEASANWKYKSPSRLLIDNQGGRYLELAYPQAMIYDDPVPIHGATLVSLLFALFRALELY